MMMHDHNLRYLLLTYLSHKRLLSPETSKDFLMRRPPTYFSKVLNRLKPTYLPRTLKYIQYRFLCHPGHISHNGSDRRVLKKFQGHPYETSSNIFCKSLKQIDVFILSLPVWHIPACIVYNSIFFRRIVDVNLFKTVTKYVAGHLISTSLGLFQDSVIPFIARYVACVTQKKPVLYIIHIYINECFWEMCQRQFI